MRAVSVAIGVGLAAALAAAPVYAAGSHPKIINRSVNEHESTHLNGLGPGCPAFAGTFTEQRHVEMSGYIRGDVAHVSEVATATVTLRPDAADAASYRGSYREVQSGVFLHHGHLTRKASTLTVGTIHGTDGSTYQTVEVAHSWRDKAGKKHGSDRFSCS